MSVFLETITVLENYGWHQGDFEGPDGSVCMGQALSDAINVTRTNWCEERDHLIPLLAPATGIAEFNDDPHTTYEDVVLLLKRAHEASDIGRGPLSDTERELLGYAVTLLEAV